MIQAVTRISPTLTKHENCSALMGMQRNTFSICGSRKPQLGLCSTSESGPVNWGLHLVPEAMPRQGERQRERERESTTVRSQ